MPPHAVKPESRLDRAKKQRMYFMGRVADAEEGSAQFLVSGSSGKVYTVSVPQTSEERAVPAAGYGGRGTAKFKCNCMDREFCIASRLFCFSHRRLVSVT